MVDYDCPTKFVFILALLSGGLFASRLAVAEIGTAPPSPDAKREISNVRAPAEVGKKAGAGPKAETKAKPVEATKPVAEESASIQEMPTVQVIGSQDRREMISGSGDIVGKEVLYRSHVFTINEALRKVPGVHVRDEEGFGMRPNIGIRGLNPTRSTRVLLLEDGLPLSYAPYGDNASYYHPPVDRFEDMEVLKGAEQLKFGPQTAAATINYITPTPPLTPKGFASFTGGNRGFVDGHLNYGGTFRNTLGGLFDYIHKAGEGARNNTFMEFDDVNLKGFYKINEQNSLILRGNYFQEDSQVTYSGITDAELRNFGYRYNPFKNDRFTSYRWGTSATHEFKFNEDVKLLTSFYWTQFNRDWWRQSSTTTDTQCGSAFRNRREKGIAVNPDTCNSTQGRLRDYSTWGIEPRLHVSHDILGVPNEMDVGFRAHFEDQRRLQENGSWPTARNGRLSENNSRYVDAYSGFIQNRIFVKNWTFTPALRVESINYRRVNSLNPKDVREGRSSLTEPLPGFGINYNPMNEISVFFGAHRGFTPPRVEDAVSNTGLATDVGAEKSWNFELGLRTKPWKGVALDGTLFHNYFEKQIAVGSIAGGTTPLAEGEALYQGLEFFGRSDFGEILNSPHNVYVQTAYTWVGNAEALSPFRCVPVDGRISNDCRNGLVSGSAEGNRMPYAPENMVTTTVGYNHPIGFDFRLETVFVDDQFADFHNARGQVNPNGTPNLSGQVGQIASYTIFNMATTYRVKPINTDFFVTVKNLLDKDYIVDRTRGILPGAPRLVQAGFRTNF